MFLLFISLASYSVVAVSTVHIQKKSLPNDARPTTNRTHRTILSTSGEKNLKIIFYTIVEYHRM